MRRRRNPCQAGNAVKTVRIPVAVLECLKSGRIGRKNPQGVIEIYGNILAIEAQKGSNDLFARKFFRHDFKGRGAKIYGLPDGSLWIKGRKRLWKNFDYPRSAKHWK